MDSNNHPKDDEEFSFFDVGETENESQLDDLWLLLSTGERFYLGYPDDLCRQCYQREGLNNVRIGECRFLVCDDCERRNFPLITQLTALIHWPEKLLGK